MTTPAVRLGTVADFDDRRGLGTVRDDESGELLGFHCTEIAGGTRTIAPGTAVAYRRAAAHGGRFEARDLVPHGGTPRGAGRPPRDVTRPT